LAAIQLCDGDIAMEPTCEIHGTLSDLLDRVLDKGLIVSADLIITLAGIPLIAVNLRAAIAGMETMLKYGVMTDWDEATRARERELRSANSMEIGRA